MEVLGVKESLVQYLRTQIIIGELEPGQKLNEVRLSSLLGISRPPLREAFRILENEHLVVSIPRKSTYVTNLSIKDLKEVFQARVMIECYAIDLLKAKNVTYLPEMESALKSTSGLATPSYENKEEVLRYLETVVAYHKKLVSSTGNHWLIHFYNSIHSSLARYQFIYAYSRGQSYRDRKEHKEMLDLIKRGEYEKTKELLRSHMDSVVDILERNITRTQQTSSHWASANRKK
jgi:DNA-binding GntR family transcriptional regulator